MSRFFVIGAGGQVGEKICLFAQSKGHQVIAAYKTRAPETRFSETITLDKTNEEDVRTVITEFRPDTVIDTAALHNVDYCESHPEEAMRVNRNGTASVARIASAIGAKFLFISTDYVFDGIGAPYSEESEPRPLSVYGKSKLAGERASLAVGKDSVVICRPAVIYSWKPGSIASQSSSGKPLNFGAWLVSQLKVGKEVRIVTDQITSPTLADDLAAAIVTISENHSASGIFHTAGATSLSRFEFSVRVATKLNLDKNLIRPIDSSQLKQVAKRPLNSSLVSQRLKPIVGYSMMEIDQALEEFARQMTSENKRN